MASDVIAPAVRRLAVGDAPALLELVVLCDIADLGEPDYDYDDAVADLSRPGARFWGVDGPDGLAAYAYAEAHQGYQAVTGDVRLRPGADPALGAPLLDLVRREAAALDPTRPLHVYASTGAIASRRLYEAAGGRLVRHFWRMVVEWAEGEAPPAPDVARTARLRPVSDADADLRAVHRVIDTAFLDHFGHVGGTSYDEWLDRNRSRSGFDLGLWWVAEVGGEPVAALVATAPPELGWVNTLATLREFRGHGLGRALLLTAFGELRRRGYRRVGLGVDAANPTGAVGLYESVGMRSVHEELCYELASIGPSPAGSAMSASKNA